MADPSFYEGFETLDPTRLPLRFTRVHNSASYRVGTAHPVAFPNGNALSFTGIASSTETLRRNVGPHSAGRFAFRYCLAPATTTIVLSGVSAMVHFEYSTALSTQFAVFVDMTTGRLQVRSGPYSYSGLLGESANSLAKGTAYHIEIQYTISNTTGSVRILVDGVEWLDLTNINTRVFNAIAEVSWLGLCVTYGYGSDYSTAYDDLVWAEGATPDLGPLSVLIAPVNGAGASTQFTPLSGTNHSNVDELLHDSDTSYVESSTDGHEDAYTVAVPDLTGYVVHAVQGMAVVRKTDVGAINAAVKLRSGASASTPAATPLGDTYALLEGNVASVDPDTSATWVNADVADVQVGVVVETV